MLPADSQRFVFPSVGLTNVRVGTSVGSEKPVPKGVDHREIAVRVQMVDEVKLLLAPEPSETSEARSSVWYCLSRYTWAQNDAALAAVTTRKKPPGPSPHLLGHPVSGRIPPEVSDG